ncbi:uncharacterized protein PRCAT00002752001 [Priceomyces carsonii]|uniref:uncharacterized protein n=1 Tax=Priceomyces carsonii TaxID=28549 RepID=UPI002ED84CA2|nr:unnamed protein product [Priceomyces carsonii]
MDLEEELSLLHEDIRLHETRPTAKETETALEEPPEQDENDDFLGLDKQIKLSTRSKIAKVDNERIFDKQRGIPYVIKNHKKLSHRMKKNDKTLAKTLSNNSHYSTKQIRRLKIENEFTNLESVIQFYQLWCHGLFPKARFRDCLRLVRSLGVKSSSLKLYRKEMIELEIRKLKTEKGLVDEVEREPLESELPEQPNGPESPIDNPESNLNTNNDNDDDDWSFMNRKNYKSNDLFVGDGYDDSDSGELYGEPQDKEMTTKNPDDESRIFQDHQQEEKNAEDGFSDDNDLVFPDTHTIDAKGEQEYPEEFDMEDDYELEIMREMDS